MRHYHSMTPDALNIRSDSFDDTNQMNFITADADDERPVVIHFRHEEIELHSENPDAWPTFGISAEVSGVVIDNSEVLDRDQAVERFGAAMVLRWEEHEGRALCLTM